jgi:hypothetical protein
VISIHTICLRRTNTHRESDGILHIVIVIELRVWYILRGNVSSLFSGCKNEQRVSILYLYFNVQRCSAGDHENTHRNTKLLSCEGVELLNNDPVNYKRQENLRYSENLERNSLRTGINYF